MWNVIGIINGSIPDEAVVLGNHRDAWVAGGAGDPNSGSAAFNELIRAFGVALGAGWKPLRTIVFASWDGEEYGLLGSTEWVEEYLPWLQDSAIAYLNVDVGTKGPHFYPSAAPLLNRVLKDAGTCFLLAGDFAKCFSLPCAIAESNNTRSDRR
jgi:N-acetylated-alpha-linked acidic dipeptidase